MTQDPIKEQQKEKFSTAQSELLIQGWNAEIIGTTFIQLFNTTFGRYVSQLRRLHNLVGSIVILDEAQAIPFEYWDAIRETHQTYNRNDSPCYKHNSKKN